MMSWCVLWTLHEEITNCVPHLRLVGKAKHFVKQSDANELGVLLVGTGILVSDFPQGEARTWFNRKHHIMPEMIKYQSLWQFTIPLLRVHITDHCSKVLTYSYIIITGQWQMGFASEYLRHFNRKQWSTTWLLPRKRLLFHIIKIMLPSEITTITDAGWASVTYVQLSNC